MIVKVIHVLVEYYYMAAKGTNRPNKSSIVKIK